MVARGRGRRCWSSRSRTAAGLIVGWRIHNRVGDASLGFGLLLSSAYAVSWILAYVGLLVPGAEVGDITA